MNNLWLKWAETRGYRIAFGDIGLLKVVREILEEQKAKDKIEGSFYRTSLSGFEYLENSNFQQNGTLVMVAIPKPVYILKFIYNEQDFKAIIPPTYVFYRPTFQKVLDHAYAAFIDYNYQIKLLNAPLKLLAVLTNLAKYGRNNIVYIQGLGSYIQLVGFVTNMPLETGNIKPSLEINNHLEATCTSCRACVNACPTGAIHKDRILLHAEKCYTLLSESSGELPGDQLPPSPECLIGCMMCQMVCPLNKGMLQYEPVPFTLTAEETTFLSCDLDEKAPIWKEICKKFDQLSMTEDTSIFARNFRRLLEIGGGIRNKMGFTL